MDNQSNGNDDEAAPYTSDEGGAGDASGGSLQDEETCCSGSSCPNNQPQPEASSSSESWMAVPAAAASPHQDTVSCSGSSEKPLRAKTYCPIMHHFKISEKRTLSGSSENLTSDDRPRKNFKFSNFMKRWFPGSDHKSGKETETHQKGLQFFEDVVSLGTPSEPGNSQQLGSSSRTCSVEELSGACVDLPTNTVSTCQESQSGDQLPHHPSADDDATSSNSTPDGRNATHSGTPSHLCSLDSNLDVIPDGTSTSGPHLCLSRLPPHVFAHIFSYLSIRELLCSAALVCTHWWRMSQMPSLWLQIRLRHFTNVADEDLIRICRRHCGIRLLDLSDCLKITDSGLQRSLVHLKMLREMFLIRCSHLGDFGFQSIAEHCSNLTHIDLSGCTSLTDAALQLIAEQCPLLQKLRLKQCSLITDASLQAVAISCPRLKVLTFMDNDKITDVTLEALGRHSHNLEILCLQNCGIGAPGLTQVTKLHLLRKLDLSNLSTLTSESVKEVAKHCQLLDTFNLSLSSDVRDECVSCVAKFCKRLTTLFLISCDITDQALFSVGDNSTCLEHLDVSWCARITGHGAIYLSEHCQSLKYLGLIRCNGVSDSVVERLVKDHPAIHYSTFLLDSKRLIDKAKLEGFVPAD